MARRNATVIAAIVALVALFLTVQLLSKNKDTVNEPVLPKIEIPTTGLSVAQAHRDGMRVTGWLTYWNNGSGNDTVLHNLDKLSSVHLFWYRSTSVEEVQIQGKKPTAVINAAKAAGVKVIPTVTESLTNEDFLTMVNDEAKRSTHARMLCTFVLENDFDGIDLDYEKIAVGTAAENISAMATGYVALVQDVANCLHPKKKTVEVTVNARTSDSLFGIGISPLSTGVFDYERLGKVADVVRIMAYDYHYAGGSPGPVAPLEWVNDVLIYATSKVKASKLELGIPTYGYDWPSDGAKGKALTAAAAQKLISSTGVTPQFDAVAGSYWFDYESDGVVRHVWFDNTSSSNLRIALAKSHNIGGVAFWALGFEQADLWAQ